MNEGFGIMNVVVGTGILYGLIYLVIVPITRALTQVPQNRLPQRGSDESSSISTTNASVINTRISEFWRATWAAWRSGALSPVFSQDYVQDATAEYSHFIKNSPYVRDPWLRHFFSKHVPRPSEFFIAHAVSGSQHSVVTSQRLWMYDKQTCEYYKYDLEDISEYRINCGWFAVEATIRLKDGAYRTYRSTQVPSEKYVRFAIERRSSIPGWPTISLPPPITEGETWYQPGETPETLHQQEDVIDQLPTGVFIEVSVVVLGLVGFGFGLSGYDILGIAKKAKMWPGLIVMALCCIIGGVFREGRFLGHSF